MVLSRHKYRSDALIRQYLDDFSDRYIARNHTDICAFIFQDSLYPQGVATRARLAL